MYDCQTVILKSNSDLKILLYKENIKSKRKKTIHAGLETCVKF